MSQASFIPSSTARRAPAGCTTRVPGVRPALALAVVVWACTWFGCSAGTPRTPHRQPTLPCPGCPGPAQQPSAAPLGLLGTADYLEFQTASPEADWAVICQARTDTTGDGQVSMNTDQWGALYGDHPVPYFIHGAGTGMPLDAYILRDATGRFLLVVRNGRLVLLDTREKVATDLSSRGAHVGIGGYPYLGHAGASFDDRGTRLLYLQGEKDQRVAVLRDLTTGVETRLPPPPRCMRYAYLHHGGQWVIWHTDLKPDHLCHSSRSEQAPATT